MTANALKGDRKLCLEAGMDDYVAMITNKVKTAFYTFILYLRNSKEEVKEIGISEKTRHDVTF